MRYALLFLVMLASCSAMETEEDTRFFKEYNVRRLGLRTREFKIWVIFPEWLHESNRDSVLEAVDSYARVICDKYPWARENFRWELRQVYIHNNMEKCVSGPEVSYKSDGTKSGPIWCYGWRSGYYSFVCWRKLPGGNPATTDILPALPHEWFHDILACHKGNADCAHNIYFNTPEVAGAIAAARAQSEPVALHTRSVDGAINFVYDPWTVPGYREE